MFFKQKEKTNQEIEEFVNKYVEKIRKQAWKKGIIIPTLMAVGVERSYENTRVSTCFSVLNQTLLTKELMTTIGIDKKHEYINQIKKLMDVN